MYGEQLGVRRSLIAQAGSVVLLSSDQPANVCPEKLCNWLHVYTGIAYGEGDAYAVAHDCLSKYAGDTGRV